MKLKFHILKTFLAFTFLFNITIGFGQKDSSVFQWFGFGESDSFRLTKPLRFYEVLCSKTGEHKFSSSFGVIRDKGIQIEVLLYTGADDKTKKLVRNYGGEDGIRSMYESPGKIVFFCFT